MATASVFVFRRRWPEVERPYRTWGYPVVPLLALGVTSWLLINCLVTAPHQALAGLALMALGLPFYWYWSTGLKMVHLHYRSQGPATGEAIVLLHGWPDSCHSYSRVMPLIPTRYRAIAPDLRGFGDSEKPETGYTIPELAADVVALLDALGIERATVVGHSFGSFVARRVAEASPGRVSRLVLIGSGFRACQ